MRHQASLRLQGVGASVASQADALEQQIEIQKMKFEQQMQQSALAMEELFDQLEAATRELRCINSSRHCPRAGPSGAADGSVPPPSRPSAPPSRAPARTRRAVTRSPTRRRRLAPAALSSEVAAPRTGAHGKPAGVAIVTGGLRGVGLRVGAFLLDDGRARRVVLIARSPPTPAQRVQRG